MIIGSSLLKAIEGFTRSLTLGSCGISRGECKLARTFTVIKKTFLVIITKEQILKT